MPRSRNQRERPSSPAGSRGLDGEPRKTSFAWPVCRSKSSWPRWDGREPVPIRMRDQGGALSQRGSFRERVPPTTIWDQAPDPQGDHDEILFKSASIYAGIDLHARSMHVCVLDAGGTVVYDRNLACHFPTHAPRSVSPPFLIADA